MNRVVRPIRIVTVAITAVAMSTVAVAMATPSSGASVSFRSLPNSVPATTDSVTGAYHSKSMTVEVALEPRNQRALAADLKSRYNPKSPLYQHWLAKGQYNAQFAPSRAQRTAVATYLRSAGLKVLSASSPFTVRASGSSAAVAKAFRTSLRNYTDNHGVRYFSNATSVQVPAALASHVYGVIGLTNSVRQHSMVQRAPAAAPTAKAKAAAKASDNNAACETGYPTAAELFDAVNNGVGFPFGYGDGPGCSGLTPSQINSIYGAPNRGARGKGAGVDLGVFELSAYQHSDIQTWAHKFYGAHYTAPLQDETVDGGPLAPICPAGDTCPASFNGYAGDIEVDADIEMQLAVSPDAHSIMVYNAPNDFTGQTELDEWTAIAAADQADVVSSSWAVCENDVTSAYVQAENTVFEKMALQGQSVFGAEGDTGAFSCIRSDGTTILNVLDPPSQPWVTSVGGTSLESDNPGTTAKPGYPAAGTETVWNVDGLCNSSADEGNQPGSFWCGATGAGGGGSSEYWGRPAYQVGKGVNNKNVTHANGTTQCSLANTGTPCRQDPDISANADEYTPYAEFCTANANTPNSQCGFSSGQLVPGWFGIGGTSLSSPLWSAIIADRDSYLGFRSGNINPLLYLLLNIAPGASFHDITGKNQAVNNNGAFPTTPGYDEATGIGTPRMGALITRLI
jgi:subtilase family serine protease